MQITPNITGEILSNTTEIANALYHSEYKVLYGHDLDAFQILVNDYLIDEWKCLGGISVIVDTKDGISFPVFYQAIVK